jgi:hypothetical protein
LFLRGLRRNQREIINQIVEASHLGARTLALSVTTMIDGVNGHSVRDEGIDNVSVATTVIIDPMGQHDHRPRCCGRQMPYAAKLQPAHTDPREFFRSNGRHERS